MIWFQFLLRSVRALRRSFMASLMMFGFPIMFFFIFGILIDSDFDLPDTLIAVNQNSVPSSVYEALSNLEGVEIEHQVFDVDQISSELEASNFSAYLDNSNSTTVAYIDSAQERTISLILRTAQSNVSISDNSVGEINLERVRVESEFVRYSIPGLFALALLQLMIFATAMPLLTERASGTWRLISCLPISPISILMGEGAARLIIAIIQMVLLYALTTFFVNISLNENPLPFIGMALVSTLMCISLGFAIGGIISDERWGIHVLTFMNLFMLFFGNVFSPVSQIDGIGYLTLINPITYVSESIRWALTGVEGYVSPVVCVAVMLGWTAFSLLLVAKYFKFETVTTE